MKSWLLTFSWSLAYFLSFLPKSLVFSLSKRVHVFFSNLLIPTSGGCRTKLQYLAAVVVPAPFLCRTPPPPPRGEAEDAPRGDPAPTLVALAAGPEKSGISTKKLKLHDK